MGTVEGCEVKEFVEWSYILVDLSFRGRNGESRKEGRKVVKCTS